MQTANPILCLVLTCFCALSPQLWAKDKDRFVVGAQDINYFPHYSFATQSDKGYAWALLQEFAYQSGYTFVFEALPIKRLQKELIKGTVDFAYPDNPKWLSNQSSAVTKYFSQPFTNAMGGTMVKQTRKGLGIHEFRSLSVPFGFTPIMWAELIASNKVKLVSVLDAQAALQMVNIGRVDGADIEYHVAQHYLKLSPSLESLVLDPSLPYDIVAFQLSTLKHPAILKELNHFLDSNPLIIDKLKQRYQLKPPHLILSESQHGLAVAVP